MANVGANNILNAINQSAAANTAQSQAFAREQMAFNSEQAQISRDWQEKMSNTAHQREVKDLLAAGLNPILSANSGASSPSGATASGASGKVDESLSSALSSYLSSLISSATQINTANISAAASKYSSDKSAAASMYGSDKSYAASMYGSNTAAAASMYGANTSAAASKYATDHSKYGAIINGANSVGDFFKKIFGSDKELTEKVNKYNLQKRNSSHK